MKRTFTLGQVAGLILSATIITSFMALLVYSNPDLSTIIMEGSGTSEVSYIILVDGSTFYARDGNTGEVTSNTNKTALIEACVTALGSNNGTILLKAGVSLNPDDVTYGNNISIIYEDGTNIYEEYYYKILVALTSPSLLNYEHGASWSITPSETIYSAFHIFVRYAGLVVNYVDQRTPPNILLDFKRFNTSDTITPLGATSSILYVNQSDVDTIANAKSLWLRRFYWLKTTSPTRLVIDGVFQPNNEHLNFSCGTYGSIITSQIFQGYRISIRAIPTPYDVAFQVTAELASRSGAIGINDPWQYSQAPLMVAMNDTLSDTAIQWQMWVDAGNCSGHNFRAYGIMEKYDCPIWWEDF